MTPEKRNIGAKIDGRCWTTGRQRIIHMQQKKTVGSGVFYTIRAEIQGDKLVSCESAVAIGSYP
jgi:hypothetical protein